MIKIISLVLVVIINPLCKEVSSTATPPHIVLIFADDLGYNDVSWHNSIVHTPNLNNLAKRGVILEQAYAQAVCTPSRAALLTGYYPIHIGMQDGTVTSSQTSGLPLDLTLLPEYLSRAPTPYRSHMVGKWHLGFCRTAYTPLQRGFHSHYGFYNGAIDYYDHTAVSGRFSTGLDYRNDTVVNRQNSGVYATTDLTNAAIQKIQAHDPNQPMFLYAAYNAPHSPFQVDDSYKSHYKGSVVPSASRRTYLAMVTALDEQVGRLVDALKQNGLWNNTVFIFYSDNGGVQRPNGAGGNNYPLRGRKSTLFEGGYRVPAFVYSELLANSGYVHDGMFHVTDLFATSIYLANNKKSSAIPQGIDGLNIWEAISDRTISPRDTLVYNVVQKTTASGRRRRALSQAAMRHKNLKIIEGVTAPATTNDWRPPPENQTDVIGSLTQYQSETIKGTNYYLFNLSDDPYETTNIASTDSTAFNKMLTMLSNVKKTVVPPIDASTTTNADPSNFGGVWSPGFC